ncbi:MAG TPA: WD40 repeat domain-containing protein [Gemmataceae bacterium]|jgi:WD40 repeat protein
MSNWQLAFVLVLTFGATADAVGVERRQTPAEKPPSAPSAATKDDAARRGKLIEMKHEDFVNGVAFSPDGKVLASCSGGRTGRDDAVRFWDPSSGKLLRRLVVRAGSGVAAIAYSPDGKTLATANKSGGGVSLYDTATDKEILHLDMRNHGERTSLAFSPNGKNLAAGCDWEVILWDLPSGKERHRFKKLDREVQVAFAEGGRTLVTGDKSGKLRFWDATSGKLIRACDVPKDGIGDRGEIHGLAVSPDGKIVVAGQVCATCLWDAATGKMLLRLPGHEREGSYYPDASFSFLPDGKAFFSGGFDSAVRHWDVTTGRELARYKTCACWYQPVAVSPDGKRVAAGGQDHFIRMWDVQTGRQLAGPIKPPRRKSKPPILHRHDGEITSLAFSPDGKKLASTGKDGQLVVSVVATRELLFETAEHWGGEYAVAWSRDGKRIASADQDGVIRLWDAATGKQLDALKGHKGIVAALIFSADNKLLASGGYDGFVFLWDLQMRKERRHWSVCKGRVTSLSFAADGKTLATGGAVRTDAGGANFSPMTHADEVRFWDAETGKALTAPALQGETVAFSADGQCLLAAGLVPDIRRDAKRISINGQHRIVVVRHGHEILRIVNRGDAAAFSLDNHFLATGTGTTLYLRGLRGGNIILGGFDDPGPTLHLWELATGKEVLQLPKVYATFLAFAPDGRTLAYAAFKEEVVLLDVVRAGVSSGGTERDILWDQLADKDAALAYRASCAFIAGGPEVVGLLRERLRPVPAMEAERVKKLLAQLGDERFAEREAASQGLLRFGAAIEPAVRQARNDRPSLEVRRRLEATLKEMAEKRLTAEKLRGVRALRVLEQIGTPEARRVLEVLSRGAGGFVRTEEARAALARLDKRGAPSPND